MASKEGEEAGIGVARRLGVAGEEAAVAGERQLQERRRERREREPLCILFIDGIRRPSAASISATHTAARCLPQVEEAMHGERGDMGDG